MDVCSYQDGVKAVAQCMGKCKLLICNFHVGDYLPSPAWPDRERKAYREAIQNFKPILCQNCAHDLGMAAIDALPKLKPLPTDPGERFISFITKPDCYTSTEKWELMNEVGGPSAAARIIFPVLSRNLMSRGDLYRRFNLGADGVGIVISFDFDVENEDGYYPRYGPTSWIILDKNGKIRNSYQVKDSSWFRNKVHYSQSRPKDISWEDLAKLVKKVYV